MTEEVKTRIAQVRRGELPDGYKRTKAGMIPNDWESQPLQTLCDINPKRNGVTPSKVTFIGMSDTDENGRIVCQHIVPYDSVCRGYTPFLRGDVLVAKITPCFENGKGAYTENLETELGFGSTEFHVLRCRPGIFGAYLFFHTQAEKFRRELQTEMTGTAGQKRVQTPSIASYCVPLPPLAEQRKIADILSAQDTVIQLTERLVTEKQRQKQYLMREFFHSRISCREPLSRLAKITMGQSPNSENYNSTYNGMPLIQGNADIRNRKPTPRMYTTEIKKQCGKGDILLSVRAPVGTVARSDIKACIGRGICAIDGGEKTEYLYQYLLYFENKWGAVSQGSTFEAISGSDIANLRVPVSESVGKVSEILSTADREIELLRRRLEQEQRRKKALSQLLLTGLVRVGGV